MQSPKYNYKITVLTRKNTLCYHRKESIDQSKNYACEQTIVPC